MNVPLFASGPVNGKTNGHRHFRTGVKTVKPERPFPTVRAHERIEALDRDARQAF